MLSKKYVGWAWIDLRFKTIIYQKDMVPDNYLKNGFYCGNPEILNENFLPHVQIQYEGSKERHVLEAQPEFFVAKDLQEQIFQEFNIDKESMKIIEVEDIGIIFPKKGK